MTLCDETAATLLWTEPQTVPGRLAKESHTKLGVDLDSDSDLSFPNHVTLDKWPNSSEPQFP